MKPRFLALFLCAVLAASCGRRDADPRVYTEPAPVPVPAASSPSSGAMPAMDVPLPPAADMAWTVPAGWTERPGEGMRRATFTVDAGGQTYECALTSLAGEAGGVSANVMRWAGQLGIAVPPERLRAFVDALPEQKTAAGAPMWVVDFASLTAGLPGEVPSMLAAIVRRPQDTLFLKFMAPRAVVEAHRTEFEALAGSLR